LVYTYLSRCIASGPMVERDRLLKKEEQPGDALAALLSFKSSLLGSLFLLLALLLPDCKPGLEPLTQLLDRVNEGFIRGQLINLLLQILHLFLQLINHSITRPHLLISPISFPNSSIPFPCCFFGQLSSCL